MTWMIRGISKGTANVKVNYNGLSCDLPGIVNIVTLNQSSENGPAVEANENLYIYRSKLLNSISCDINDVQYYVSGGSYNISKPTVSVTYKAGVGNLIIFYDNFKNKPVITSSDPSKIYISSDPTASSKGIFILTAASNGDGSEVSATVTIKDGENGSVVWMGDVIGSAVSTDSEQVLATGVTNTSGSYITVTNETSNSATITAKSINTAGSEQLRAYYTYGGETFYCNIGEQIVGVINWSDGTSTNENSILERPKKLSSISLPSNTNGSDDISVKVGSIQTFIRPNTINLNYSTDITAKNIIAEYAFSCENGANMTKPLFIVNGTNINPGVPSESGRPGIGSCMLSTTENTLTGTSVITAKMYGKPLRGFIKSVEVKNENTASTSIYGTDPAVTYTSENSSYVDIV